MTPSTFQLTQYKIILLLQLLNIILLTYYTISFKPWTRDNIYTLQQYYYLYVNYYIYYTVMVIVIITIRTNTSYHACAFYFVLFTIISL
jgi:hypothetical protein